jgi:hypothetical protein
MSQAMYKATVNGTSYSLIDTKTTYNGEYFVPYWKW